MNRCPSVSQFAWAAALAFAVLLGTAVSAQTADPQRIPPISVNAKRGVLLVTSPPEVLLDGQSARLAPGARIRDRNNLMVVSGALQGQQLPVRYTLDPLGLVYEVWVLTANEAAVGMPAPRALDSSY